MQQYIRPFSAVDQSSQTLAVTASNQSLTLPTGIGTRTIRILVSGSQTVFWRYNAAATVAASTPILAGLSETFLLPNDATTINFIAGATGSTVYITIGESA